MTPVQEQQPPSSSETIEPRLLRCTSCDPPRKFKAQRDLAAHILSKHGRITMKQRQQLRRVASAISFCDESPPLCATGGVRKQRRYTARRNKNVTSTTCLTVCTRKQPVPPTAVLATIPSRKPLVLDFAQSLF